MWIKVLHLAAVISWMAGLLYLPRLFVYHSDVVVKSETSDLFIIMERRLLVAIMNPAAIVALLSGLWLAYEINAFKQGWFHLKVLMLLGLFLSHYFCFQFQQAFARDERPLSSRGFRFFNEIPTLLMLIILVAVIIKPGY